MMVLFPRQVWVLKRELLWIPVVGWGMRQLHAIAIDRKAGHSAVSQVVEQGKQRLAEGDWVMIFPEGTRMPIGETRRYGVSGTLLAQETGRLIVPVAHNAGFYWPRRGLMKKPGTVRVVIGRAVRPARPRGARGERGDPGVGRGHRAEPGAARVLACPAIYRSAARFWNDCGRLTSDCLAIGLIGSNRSAIQTSRLVTESACFSMNSRRGST